MNVRIFILKLTAFVILFVIADQIAGYGFRLLEKNAGDKFERENYMRNDMRADVLVMGSSKAVHHYQPSILEDSLNMKVYNCGQRGNGVIYEYGRLATIYPRYTPKMIIVDVIKKYDLEKNDNSRYLDFLKVDYGQNTRVDSLFFDIDKNNRYKLFLECYRYNSTILDLLINSIIRNRGRFQKDGYFPLRGNKNIALDNDVKSTELIQIDSIKVKYLERIAKDHPPKCVMIFVISPSYRQGNPNDYFIVNEICGRYNVPLLNYENDKRFLGRKDLYYDGSHLNEKGACLYSKIVASDVKKIWRQYSD